MRFSEGSMSEEAYYPTWSDLLGAWARLEVKGRQGPSQPATRREMLRQNGRSLLGWLQTFTRLLLLKRNKM
jgi:hypothetical protein